MRKKEKYNWTTSFALPLLGWPKKMYEPYLVNAYIDHEGVDHFKKDHLFVLLKESTDDKFKKLEEVLMSHRTHVTQYYVDEAEEYSMHVFKFVEEVIPDYHLFLEGKYSRMSEGAKALIKKSSKPHGNNWKILSRHPSLREYHEKKIGVSLRDDQEVWSVISDSNRIKREVFNEELFETIKGNS